MIKWEEFKKRRDVKVNAYVQEEKKKLDHFHDSNLQEGWKT